MPEFCFSFGEKEREKRTSRQKSINIETFISSGAVAAVLTNFFQMPLIFQQALFFLLRLPLRPNCHTNDRVRITKELH